MNCNSCNKKINDKENSENITCDECVQRELNYLSDFFQEVPHEFEKVLMTNKELQEILLEYPDEAIIKLVIDKEIPYILIELDKGFIVGNINENTELLDDI